ncbi:hypothetical protein Q9L58_010214 [Maublancomyces gigas]|uniref:Uncharacterized protein n=1 Tax=Discina gigas TaxID=1032678 RepID=A0ABR3G4Y9_9PEZI
MLSRGFLIFVFLTSTASALVIPLFNFNTNQDVQLEKSFQPEPQGRGTVGILLSCTLTFALCIWTTVHPSILPGTAGKFRLKLMWMVVAIVLPEVLMLCALGERRQARRVRLCWEKTFAPSPPEGDQPKIKQSKDNQFGLACGFFVVMGGVTATDSDGNVFILTVDGFISHVESGNITQESIDIPAIMDKGNSSDFAKFITFLQAVWFLCQGSLRWYAALPVTLLERHVAIQVAFTLFTCLFWWSKPLDIDYPILISLVIPPGPEEQVPPPPPQPRQSHTASVGPVAFPGVTSDTEKIGEILPETTAGVRITSVPRIPINESKLYDNTRLFFYENPRSGFACLFARALHDAFRYPTTGAHSDMFLIVLLLVGNGIWHLLSWTVHFPTNAEQVLWGASCILVCVSAVIHGFLTVVKGAQLIFISGLWEARFMDENLVFCFVKLFRKFTQEAKFAFWKKFLLIIIWILGILYVCGIGFIMVESFISMRSLILGSYETQKSDPSKYFPSFG